MAIINLGLQPKKKNCGPLISLIENRGETRDLRLCLINGNHSQRGDMVGKGCQERVTGDIAKITIGGERMDYLLV